MDTKSRGSWLRYLLPLLIFTVLVRVYGLDRFSFDRDELASAAWALAPTWQALRLMLFDVFEGNAAGYPVFIRLWGGVSLSEFWLRLPSVLASSAIVLVFLLPPRSRAWFQSAFGMLGSGLTRIVRRIL